MAVVYKFIFSAGWNQAVGIGVVGGLIGWLMQIVLFAVMNVVALVLFGL